MKGKNGCSTLANIKQLFEMWKQDQKWLGLEHAQQQSLFMLLRHSKLYWIVQLCLEQIEHEFIDKIDIFSMHLQPTNNACAAAI